MSSSSSSSVMSLGLMVVFIVLIYFMMIRPQKKKDKADQEMRASLRVGDEVITIGGIIGRVEKITDKTVVISTTAGKNKIEFLKTAIASVGKDSGAASDQPKSKAEPKEEEKTEKAPSRDKKVTPKKLGKKSEDKAAEAEAPAGDAK